MVHVAVVGIAIGIGWMNGGTATTVSGGSGSRAADQAKMRKPTRRGVPGPNVQSQDSIVPGDFPDNDLAAWYLGILTLESDALEEALRHEIAHPPGGAIDALGELYRIKMEMMAAVLTERDPAAAVRLLKELRGGSYYRSSAARELASGLAKLDPEMRVEVLKSLSPAMRDLAIARLGREESLQIGAELRDISLANAHLLRSRVLQQLAQCQGEEGFAVIRNSGLDPIAKDTTLMRYLDRWRGTDRTSFDEWLESASETELSYVRRLDRRFGPAPEPDFDLESFESQNDD